MSITVKHRVSLDLSLTGAQATIPFVKGDVAAHEVLFVLRNGSDVVELPPGTVATIFIHNGAEGSGVADMCVIDHVNNMISYTATKAAISVAGSITCELKVVGAYGESLGTPVFIFFVDESMMDVTEEEINKALVASDSWGVIQSTKSNAEKVAAAVSEVTEKVTKAAKSATNAAASETNAAESAKAAASSETAAKASEEAAAARAEEAAASAETAGSAGSAAVQAAEQALNYSRQALTAKDGANDAAARAEEAAASIAAVEEILVGAEETLRKINDGGIV